MSPRKRANLIGTCNQRRHKRANGEQQNKETHNDEDDETNDDSNSLSNGDIVHSLECVHQQHESVDQKGKGNHPANEGDQAQDAENIKGDGVQKVQEAKLEEGGLTFNGVAIRSHAHGQSVEDAISEEEEKEEQANGDTDRSPEIELKVTAVAAVFEVNS